MKKMKKVVVLLLMLTMVIGVTTSNAYANTSQDITNEEAFDVADYLDICKKHIKKDASKEEIAKLTELLEKAFQLERELEKAWTEIENTDIIDFEALEEEWENHEDAFEFTTFEMLKEEFGEGLSEEVLAKAERLFNQAKALEKEKKYEEAEKVWDQLYDLEVFEEEVYTFEMLKEEYGKGLSEEVLAKAEKLFNQAEALEKEEKFEEAEKVWDQLFELQVFEEDEEE